MRHLLVWPFLLFALLFYSPRSHATADQFSIGVSHLAVNLLNRVSTEPTGAPNALGTSYFLPTLSYGFSFGDYAFIPYLSYQLPFMNKSKDGTYSETVTMLGLPFSMLLGEGIGAEWSARAGLGLLNHTIKGEGGTKELNNGTSTTKFGVPGRSATSRLLYLSGGAEAQFSSIKVISDLLLFNAMNNDRRSFNFLFSVLYAF